MEKFEKERWHPGKLTTILSTLEALRETELKEPKPPTKKRRKTDIRTLRRRNAEAVRKYKRERADLMREIAGTLRNQFFHLRRYVRQNKKLGRGRCSDWELSMQEWLEMWASCPAVDGKPAWKMRGQDRHKDVQLLRIDSSQAYRIDNLLIKKGKEVLWQLS